MASFGHQDSLRRGEAEVTTKVLQEAAVRGDQIAAMLAEMQHPRGAADLKLAEPISGIPGVSGWAACKHGQAAQTLTFVSREVMGESESWSTVWQKRRPTISSCAASRGPITSGS